MLQLTLAKEWLEEYDKQAQIVYNQREIAAWNYESNLTDYNKDLSVSLLLVEPHFENS